VVDASSHDLYRALLDAMSSGVIVWRLAHAEDDESLQLVYANRPASVLTARDLDLAVGKRLLDIFPAAPHVGAIAAVCRDGRPRNLGAFVYRDVIGPESTYSSSIR
jgi:hypothetical protein